MAANVEIADGMPIWLSTSIVPSKDKVVSPTSAPSIAAITVSSTDVYVYVKVKNIGSTDLGSCTCTVPLPALWPLVADFTGFEFQNQTKTQTNAGVTFTARPSTNAVGDTLTGAVSYSWGPIQSGYRVWAWSPDNQLFAHVYKYSTNGWVLTIVTLKPFTLSDGTLIAAGTKVAEASGVYASGAPFDTTNFGWAGSSAVVSGISNPGGTGFLRGVTCPKKAPGAPSTKYWGNLFPDTANNVDWDHRVSPCGSVVAFVPRILNSSVGSREVTVVATESAQPGQLKKNNVPTPVSITGSNPSLRTLQHTALGVDVNTGSGIVKVDDPDCTFVGGGVLVTVDRVKATTLPGANVGVVSVGTSSPGNLRVNSSAWLQVVNGNGWKNDSIPHWCLLAQAYTADWNTSSPTISRPWSGQAPNPPAFPLANQNCAQRNIEIF